MSKTLPLHIENLQASYPGQSDPAIHNINWSIKSGELWAVIGPNGAGKSTLLKSAMGLLPQSNGKIEFFGQNLKKARRKIAYIPQRNAVDWDFPVSVLDVATMGLYGHIGWLSPIRKQHKEQAMAALKQVGMHNLAHRQIGALSGGQQQRTFLARALAQNADLYLMDEPFAGVDVPTEEKIIEILHSLKAAGKTIAVVHHDLGTVEKVFEHALLLNQTTIAQGKTKKVLSVKSLSQAYGSPLSAIG